MVWVRWHCRTPHLWCIKYHTITLTSCKASRLLVACERWHGGNWQINVATSGIFNILIATYTHTYIHYLTIWYHMYLYTGKKGAIFRPIWKTLSWRRRPAPTSCKEKTHLKAKKGTSGISCLMLFKKSGLPKPWIKDEVYGCQRQPQVFTRKI